ncbi:MAG TPA: hypothetical protein VGB92_00770 [Longimicrobium sp.]|jgi:uncharacterized membrane protein
MQARQLRARRPGEILSAAIQIVRAHYKPLLLASAVFLVPGELFVLAQPYRDSYTDILDLILALAASTTVAMVVSDIYTGKEPDVRRSIEALFSRSGSVLAAGILQGIILLTGLLLLVVPAFIFYAWTFAMPVIVVLEGAGAYEAYGRSRALAKGNVRHVLVTLAMTWASVVVLYFGTLLSINVVTEFVGIYDLNLTLIDSAMRRLAHPLVSVVATVLYYDLRIRQEGFDLQPHAGEMNREAPRAFA